jgi:hypothetical protein
MEDFIKLDLPKLTNNEINISVQNKQVPIRIESSYELSPIIKNISEENSTVESKENLSM